jgi:hypothetical protein
MKFPLLKSSTKSVNLKSLDVNQSVMFLMFSLPVPDFQEK